MTAPSRESSYEPSGSGRPVHLLGGLPTEGARRGFDRIRHVLPLKPLAGFIEPTLSAWEPTGVVLPPHVETSQLVEDWEASDYLEERFGHDAHIGNVLTVLDSDRVDEQLTSADPIAAHGWGRGFGDVRSVADITVGLIESATHLVLVGARQVGDAAHRALDVLNPGAERLSLEAASNAELHAFVTCPRRGFRAASARIVPPWLDLLQAASTTTRASDRFVYRRSRPFDPERFRSWLASPPRNLIRGKGKLWLADRSEEALGYSCAGSVHRVFAAGLWWASCGGSAWPKNDAERRRLLERWHPRFGDRRQEIAFLGVDLDAEEISATLDACLLSEKEALSLLVPDSPGDACGGAETDGGGLQ